MNRSRLVRGATLSAAAIVLLAACSAKAGEERTTGAPPSNATGTTAATVSGDVSTSSTPSAVPIATAPEQDGVQHLQFSYGPIKIEPGQNNITISNLQVPKPAVDGYITAIRPDLKRTDGTIPGVDVIHLHHGVWVNLGHGEDPTATTTTAAATTDTTARRRRLGGQQELFFAAGEEKTAMLLPAGFGYKYSAKDAWIINYMLHNLLSTPDEVSITYELDFIPADSPAAANIKPARPIWNDVQTGHIYPVFDVLRKDGKNGLYTYPDDVPTDPYAGGRPLNEVTIDRDSVLLGTAGHVHPGGLHTDMYVRRAGASAAPDSPAAASVVGDTAHIFRSQTVYFEPAGAVSWDVAMTATPFDWNVSVKKGDVIRITATYDTTKASWYESMGIMVLWATDAANVPNGNDPFTTKVDRDGLLTHGHLPENDNHGGPGAPKATYDNTFVDLTKAPSGASSGTVTIADFTYAPGDMTGISGDVPTVKPGEALKFTNLDNPLGNGIWHTITACKAPCDAPTGIAYPLADGSVEFDSGELGTGGPPTADRVDWTIPTDLNAGTYTYFCRIHPSMRGAFRVDPNAPAATATTAAPTP